MPPHWFGPQIQPLLRQLIVHIRNSELLTAALRDVWATTAPIHFSERFEQLQQQLALEGKIIAGISQKLRLTPAARTTMARGGFCAP